MGNEVFQEIDFASAITSRNGLAPGYFETKIDVVARIKSKGFTREPAVWIAKLDEGRRVLFFRVIPCTKYIQIALQWQAAINQVFLSNRLESKDRRRLGLALNVLPIWVEPTDMNALMVRLAVAVSKS
ncbi:hypothetical protein C5Y93_27070 [Blastopirellula marina]|uniref:Uncharacterized protein n=1 Tax=Blastopirellula marina TaxID=124 RepID=A0A2S8GC77_9BACT|nr:hypothetical protein C5Y93_27070 [Blastopirellula marina]